MMRPDNDIKFVWLCRAPVDFRKQINGLSILVEEQLSQDPFSGQLFVFVNKNRDKIKILYWERAGFAFGKSGWNRSASSLVGDEQTKWPDHLDGELLTLDGQQLNWLLDGYDLAAMRPHRSLAYTTVL